MSLRQSRRPLLLGIQYSGPSILAPVTSPLYLINRAKGHFLFSPPSLRFFFLLATPLHPSAAALTELRLCIYFGRCIDLIAPESCGISPLLQQPL